jgi:hypothetical protein
MMPLTDAVARTKADPWDEKTWIKANPSWGQAVQPDAIRGIMRQARNNPAQEAVALTRHLNVWMGEDASAISELGKQGDVALAQDDLFMPIQVSRAATEADGSFPERGGGWPRRYCSRPNAAAAPCPLQLRLPEETHRAGPPSGASSTALPPVGRRESRARGAPNRSAVPVPASAAAPTVH